MENRHECVFFFTPDDKHGKQAQEKLFDIIREMQINNT